MIKCSLLVTFFAFLISRPKILVVNADAERKVHIVYMGERQHHDPEVLTSLHHDMLSSVFGSKKEALDSMLYSYKHGFSGFAAKLTDSQAHKIAELAGVIHVTPSEYHSVETTRSWDYLGLYSNSPPNHNLLQQANFGDGIIIGVLDTGIWPESEQFKDSGLSPIPARWKGRCESGEQFDAGTACNRKLIGAKWFAAGILADNSTELADFLSPRDANGHGTHTSATAAGSFAHNATYRGLGAGLARGGAPRARLAVYKVCWNGTASGSCTTADILKGFDEAIHDGVDVLSVSLGQLSLPLTPEVDERNGIAVGAFHAVAKGIVVVCSGGNQGPALRTVHNVAPWILTVAASTVDRSFRARITLGNNFTVLGQAMFTGKEVGFTGLVYSRALGPCESLSVTNNTQVVGNVVLCFTASASRVPVSRAASSVRTAGGVGLIVAKNAGDLLSQCTNDDFPCIEVDYELATQIVFYVGSTSSPSVKLSPSTTLVGKPESTEVAYFSSRGPNSIAPAILKPDLAAPGVNILAASSPFDPFADGGFAFYSGTSMATPHVSGIAALLKALHPDWFPAAIKSALVTTAWKTDPFGEPVFAEGSQKLANPFDFGGGIVNPNKAAKPGLVYDMGTSDYINYLCAVGYNDSSITRLVNQSTVCPSPKPSVLEVNLPSITIPNLRNSVYVTRTVTNVGPLKSKYKAVIDPPLGVKVAVRPEVLVFNSTVKALSFRVEVSTSHTVNTGYYFGSLTWTSEIHVVTIPISVKTQITQFYTGDN